jgi:DNA polymerase III epsilon subunit-like protein
MTVKVSLDTETGGLDPAVAPLLSVSLVELTASLDVGRIATIYMNPLPGQTVHPKAAEVNGYTPQKWAERGAVSLREGMDRMLEWVVPGSKAIAHNASFDKRFILAALAACKYESPFLPEWSCTMEAMKLISRRNNIRFPNWKLDSLVQATGLYKVGHVREIHEAEEDAIMCAQGYKWLTQQWKGGTIG